MTKNTVALAAAALGALLLTAACGQAASTPTRAATPAAGATGTAPTAAPTAPSPASTPTTVLAAVPSPASTPTAASPAPTSSSAAAASVSPTPRASTGGNVSQTRMQFTAGDAVIVVRIADNPTTRDLVASLPMTLEFREFAGNEKISYLPRRLTTQGSPGTNPRIGDLIYYVPWGNLGFFYQDGGGYSDEVIPIGSIESGRDRLTAMETGPVRVELVP
jgi:hypothetical protein